MLAIQVISAIKLVSNENNSNGGHHQSSAYRHQYYATILYENQEIHRTAISSEISDPIWQEVVMKPLDELRGRERDQNRPLFFEHFKVIVYQIIDRNNNVETIGETRVSLLNLGTPQWYKLIKQEKDPSNNFSPSKDAGLLLFALTLSEDILGEGRIVGYQSLHDEIMNKRIQCSPLFLNFDLSPLSLIGADPMPGPSVGEIILDRHETVEVEAFTGTNSFGDKYRVICRGTLYLTDLRLLYITTAITSSPSGYNFFDIPNIDSGDCRNDSELLALRRTSFSIPLTSIQESRLHSIDTSTCAILVTTRDAISTEFIVKRPATKRRKGVMQQQEHQQQQFFTSNTSNSTKILSKQKNPAMTLPDCEPINEQLQQKKLNFRSYRSGIQSEDVSPSLWCSRVLEEIVWRIREDNTWIKWAKYLRESVQEVVKTFALTEFLEEDFGRELDGEDDDNYPTIPVAGGATGSKGYSSGDDKHEKTSSQWWKSCLNIPSVIRDYTRLDVEGGNVISQWWICTNNINYEICDTYPQTLVFPCSISDSDIDKASSERSRQRLPSLVWIHPISRVPLCRSSQPLVGLSKAPEFDKKLCLAIQQSSSTKFSLRIADARPFINAQANAIQGKGYENISFLGGTSVAQLFFLDIQNIHVMRDSLQRLRDSYTILPFDSSFSGSSTGDTIASDATEQAVSKWLGHVSSVLKGAASVAESILLGHPVLVHCSDGWDRTAQLTSLAQLLLDPHYRTIEGFLLLIEKEWISFGHQFKHRLGKLTHKETSPVFLQFLDCVTQMISQFPSEFEYSIGFLEVLAKCTYSGYFSSFRQDCESQRNAELLSAISNFAIEFDSEDLNYTSVFAYVRILLHSSIGDLLLNPYFCPPEATQVKYLRPRCSPTELILWQQGLIPRHLNRFAGVGGGGRGGLSRVECEALSAGTYTRLLNYWNLHMNELPLSSQTRINLLCSNHRGRLFTISTPHQVTRRKARYTVLPENVSHEEGLFTSSANLSVYALAEVPKQRAAITLQNWYRSLSITNKAVRELKRRESLTERQEGIGEGAEGEGLSVRERRIVKAFEKPQVKAILRVLVWSLLISRTQLNENITAIVHRQITSILDEVISAAFDFCFSKEIYGEIEEHQRASMRANDSIISGGIGNSSSSSSSSNSFAKKMMKKGVKKFNKLTKSIYG